MSGCRLVVTLNQELVCGVTEFEWIGAGVDRICGTANGVGKRDVGIQNVASDRIKFALRNDVTGVGAAAIRFAQNELIGVDDTAGRIVPGGRKVCAEVSPALRSGGYKSAEGARGALPKSAVAAEEEEFIFDNGTSERSSELIAVIRSLALGDTVMSCRNERGITNKLED